MIQTTMILAANGDGTNQLTNLIDSFRGTGQAVGGAIAILAFVVVAIVMMLGSLGQGGGVRKYMGAVLGVCCACVLLGGAVAFGPMLVSVGQDAGNQTTQTPTEEQGVN